MLAERAKKTADLFSPLAETSPNQFLSPRAERMRFLETDQVEKRRIDIGFRVETPPGDPMTAGDPVGGSKEDGDGAKRFASWLRRKSVDGFLLEHQHHFFRQRSGENGVHPGSADRVGEVGNNLERLTRRRAKSSQRMMHRVALQQAEGVRIFSAQFVGEITAKARIFLHGEDDASGSEQGGCQGSETGADLNHRLAGFQFGEFD